MRFVSLFNASVALALTACSNLPSAVDTQFGASVRQMLQSQTANPKAPLTAQAPAPTDGQAAKAAIDRYQKSFETPPLPANVFNIGVGSGTASAGGTAR